MHQRGNGEIVVPSPYKRERDQRRSTGTPWRLLQGHPSGSVRPLGEAVPSNGRNGTDASTSLAAVTASTNGSSTAITRRFRCG